MDEPWLELAENRRVLVDRQIILRSLRISPPKASSTRERVKSQNSLVVAVGLVTISAPSYRAARRVSSGSAQSW